MLKNSWSTLLFAEPSFLSGMAQVLDLGATFNNYNYANNPDTADYNAILSDWLAVGNDIKKAYNMILLESNNK